MSIDWNNAEPDWPSIEPPLSVDEKALLWKINKTVALIGFFGSTDQRDFIECLAVAVRMTRDHDNQRKD